MNPQNLTAINQLSNNELLKRVKRLAGREREATASLIAHLAELDARRLYLAEGLLVVAPRRGGNPRRARGRRRPVKVQ